MRIILVAFLPWTLMALPAILGWFQSKDWKRWAAWTLLLLAAAITLYNAQVDLREERVKALIERKATELSDWIVTELGAASSLEYDMRDKPGRTEKEFLAIYVPRIETWRNRVSKHLAKELPKSGADARFLTVAGEVSRGGSLYEYTRLTRLSEALGHILDRPESYVARSVRRSEEPASAVGDRTMSADDPTGWDRVVYGAIGGAIGVVLGFVLNEIKNGWTRYRTHKAYWLALRAEVEFAKKRAHTLTNDPVMAPLYRLPNVCFTTCYPGLLADGVMSDAESTALMAFYAEVETLNRGLDRASDADGDERLRAEHGRNRLKAEGLLQNGPLYMAAASAIAAHTR